MKALKDRNHSMPELESVYNVHPNISENLREGFLADFHLENFRKGKAQSISIVHDF